MTDRFDLQRFVDAQHRFYPTVVAELTRGSKRTHWMWFMFPQAEGLGQSPTARRYAIRSRAEAKAYLQQKTLGPALLECTGLVLRISNKSALQIFGSPDDLKFCSCMTLFDAVAPDGPFTRAIDRYYEGGRDMRTLDILAAWDG
jgi:uncharacterized protein (DUF1810 family)